MSRESRASEDIKTTQDPSLRHRMADSKGIKKSSNLDFVKCDVCFTIIDTPKTLPCLHTFCLSCLTNHAKTPVQKNPNKYTNIISCPNCSKEFSLPKGGVQNLRTNHFVNKLKQRYCLEQKFHDADRKTQCSSCDSPDIKLAGVCLHCNDFLCTKCLESHTKVKQEKQHKVVTLEELRTGKFTMLDVPEQETCTVHNKVIRLYCCTCSELMCKDCAVTSDHLESNHKHLKLKTTASDKNIKLQVMYSQVKHIPKAFIAAIAEDGRVLREFEANIQNVIAEYERMLKTELDTADTDFRQKLNKLESERKTKINAHLEILQSQNAHLQSAMKLTKLVTKTGSDHDVIAMYPYLSDVLQEAFKLNPIGIAKTVGKVDFIPNEQPGISHGSLVTFEQWTLDKVIAEREFTVGRGISIIANNRIAVASLHASIEYRIREPVQIFDFNGICHIEMNPRNLGGDNTPSDPWQIVSSKDGNKCYLTDNMYVKVFDNSEGQFEYVYRFCAYKPDGSLLDAGQTRLTGLAIDSSDNIYVGCESYISIHDDLGNFISGFDVLGMRPYYLSTMSNGHLIISDCGGCTTTVHIFDINGTKLHTFETPPGLVPGVSFHPSGVCIVHDEIFVVHTYLERECAVYRYSFTGKYLGVVTKDLYEPYGITLKDDTELLVLENDCIKIFRLE